MFAINRNPYIGNKMKNFSLFAFYIVYIYIFNNLFENNFPFWEIYEHQERVKGSELKLGNRFPSHFPNKQENSV